jgi:hypothetical protein
MPRTSLTPERESHLDGVLKLQQTRSQKLAVKLNRNNSGQMHVKPWGSGTNNACQVKLR